MCVCVIFISFCFPQETYVLYFHVDIAFIRPQESKYCIFPIMCSRVIFSFFDVTLLFKSFELVKKFI